MLVFLSWLGKQASARYCPSCCAAVSSVDGSTKLPLAPAVHSAGALAPPQTPFRADAHSSLLKPFSAQLHTGASLIGTGAGAGAAGDAGSSTGVSAGPAGVAGASGAGDAPGAGAVLLLVALAAGDAGVTSGDAAGTAGDAEGVPVAGVTALQSVPTLVPAVLTVTPAGAVSVPQMFPFPARLLHTGWHTADSLK